MIDSFRPVSTRRILLSLFQRSPTVLCCSVWNCHCTIGIGSATTGQYSCRVPPESTVCFWKWYFWDQTCVYALPHSLDLVLSYLRRAGEVGIVQLVPRLASKTLWTGADAGLAEAACFYDAYLKRKSVCSFIQNATYHFAHLTIAHPRVVVQMSQIQRRHLVE